MAAPYHWDSTNDEFLNLPRHILEFVTTENSNKREISLVGRSGCGLGINVKRVGAETKAVTNSGMQCSSDVENRDKTRMH